MATTTDIPEELSVIESPEVLKAFHSLNEKQQCFILHYLKCGVGAEAYRKSYNELADNSTAAVCGSQLLRNPNIKIILAAHQDFRDEDLQTVRKVFLEASTTAIKPIYGKDELGQPIKIEDLPDHDIRIKGANGLAKLHGLNAPDKQEHTGKDGGPIIIASTPTDEKL